MKDLIRFFDCIWNGKTVQWRNEVKSSQILKRITGDIWFPTVLEEVVSRDVNFQTNKVLACLISVLAYWNGLAQEIWNMTERTQYKLVTSVYKTVNIIVVELINRETAKKEERMNRSVL